MMRRTETIFHHPCRDPHTGHWICNTAVPTQFNHHMYERTLYRKSGLAESVQKFDNRLSKVNLATREAKREAKRTAKLNPKPEVDINKERNKRRREQYRNDKQNNPSEINTKHIMDKPRRPKPADPVPADPIPAQPESGNVFLSPARFHNGLPVRYPGIGGSAPNTPGLRGSGSPYRDALLYSQPRGSTT